MARCCPFAGPTTTTTHNYQRHCIWCIWNLKDDIVVQTTLRYIRPNIPHSSMSTLVIQDKVTAYQALEFLARKTSISHILKHDYCLITALGDLIAVFFMRFCEYSKTPKSKIKSTKILQKFYIKLYKKRHKLKNNGRRIQLEEKLLRKFRMQKNGLKEATVDQRHKCKNLYPVKIWSNIITRLYL